MPNRAALDKWATQTLHIVGYNDPDTGKPEPVPPAPAAKGGTSGGGGTGSNPPPSAHDEIPADDVEVTIEDAPPTKVVDDGPKKRRKG